MRVLRKPQFSTNMVIFLILIVLLGFRSPTCAGAIQLPQTGQTTCYSGAGAVIPCPGTGQDGNTKAGVAWPNPRFSVSGDCVTDNLTGLMWAKDANLANGTMTWQGALDYVASMNSGSGMCGLHDWRLPNVIELESLVHSDQSYSATWLNTQGFTNVHSDSYYWSSSSHAYYNDGAWVVSMWFGNLYFGDKINTYYFWLVRSGL